MGEKQATDVAAAVATGAGDQGDGTVPPPPPRGGGIQYCSKHLYRAADAAAAAAVAGVGICAFCLQEKLHRLVSSSNSSAFPLGGHPPLSFRHAAEKNTPASSSSCTAASAGGGGPRRELEHVVPPAPSSFPCSSAAASLVIESPPKKSFWSFLSLNSSAYAHQAAAASTPYATNAGAAAATRRKSVSVASAAWASRGTGDGAQDQQPRGGTSSTLAVVVRSLSVGCGRRSFSGDFLERLSNGFGDCTLRSVESHREPTRSHKMRGGLRHLGGSGAGADDDYGLSAAEGAGVGNGTKRSSCRSHWSWAWALARPMRALRPTTITVVPPVTVHGNSSASALSIPSAEAARGGELKFGAGRPVN